MLRLNLFSSNLARLSGCAVIIALAGACAKKEDGAAARKSAAAAAVQPVEVIAMAHHDLAETLNVVGTVAANESTQVRAEFSGLVRNIFFDEGQRVKKGDVLVKIDDTELVVQVAQAEASFKLAELGLKRSETLAQSRNISQADFDKSTSEFNITRAQFNLLRTRLQKTEIKAPFDGVVGSRTISPGDYVTTDSTITVIDDLSRLKIDFPVPERFLRKVKVGAPFVMKSRSLELEKPIHGEVYFVSSTINRQTRSSEVKGYITDPPPEMKPGMFANVEVVLDVRKGALTVPEGSIFNGPTGPQVVVVREKDGVKTADFVPVIVGLRSRNRAEITPVKASDFTEGLSVVASGVGALSLFQGAKLDPRPLRKEFMIEDEN